MEDTALDVEKQQLEARGYRFKFCESRSPSSSAGAKTFYAELWYRSELVLKISTPVEYGLALQNLIDRAHQYEPEEAGYELRRARRNRVATILLAVVLTAWAGTGLWIGWRAAGILGAVIGLLVGGFIALLLIGEGLTSLPETLSDLSSEIGMLLGPPAAFLLFLPYKPDSWNGLVWLGVMFVGGMVAFTVWADPAKLDAFGLFFAAIEKHAGAAALPHGPLFGVSDFDVFREMVHDAGLHEPEVSQLDIAWRMSTLDVLLDGFADWANTSLLPEVIQNAVEADVRQAGQAYRNDGDYAIPNPVILVSATR